MNSPCDIVFEKIFYACNNVLYVFFGNKLRVQFFFSFLYSCRIYIKLEKTFKQLKIFTNFKLLSDFILAKIIHKGNISYRFLQ